VAPSDIHRLVQLEEESWTSATRTHQDDIMSSMDSDSTNDFVLVSTKDDVEEGGRVIAAIYSQLVDDLGSIDLMQNVANAASHRSPVDGTILQLIRVNAQSECLMSTGSKVPAGALLRDFCLEFARELGCRSVCAVTRCTDFDAEAEDFEKYVHAQLQARTSSDSGLSFHLGKGAQFVKCIPNWRAGDTQNAGYGVLIQYQIDTIIPHGTESLSAALSTDWVSQDAVVAEVHRKAQFLLKKDVQRHSPLMAAGLDSLLITAFTNELGKQNDFLSVVTVALISQL
jgi:hypothetical protein